MLILFQGPRSHLNLSELESILNYAFTFSWFISLESGLQLLQARQPATLPSILSQDFLSSLLRLPPPRRHRILSKP